MFCLVWRTYAVSGVADSIVVIMVSAVLALSDIPNVILEVAGVKGFVPLSIMYVPKVKNCVPPIS